MTKGTRFHRYKPGTVVRIGWRFYNHYAIVSDRWIDGAPMLISLSRRTATVAEEPWQDVVQGRSVRNSSLCSELSPRQVVDSARARIGTRRYNLLNANCEHFVRACLGLPVRSPQVRTAAGVGVSTLLVALRFAGVNPVVAIAATAVSMVIGTRYSAR